MHTDTHTERPRQLPTLRVIVRESFIHTHTHAHAHTHTHTHTHRETTTVANPRGDSQREFYTASDLE